MTNISIDFKELNRSIRCYEILVGELYDMKKELENNISRTDKQEGMLIAVNHLWRWIEKGE